MAAQRRGLWTQPKQPKKTPQGSKLRYEVVCHIVFPTGLLRCVAAHHFIPSVFKSLTSSVFFYPHETSTIISLEGGSWSTKAKRKDDREEKDDKGKGKQEEQEAEDTTAQKKKVQDGAEERRHEDSSADNYDLEESKGIAMC
jgi:hypothetical protein